MAHALVEYLGVAETEFLDYIGQLEAASSYAGTDIRLTSEIAAAVREKTMLLGLDPDDTTGEELYYALCAKVREDDLRLRELLIDKSSAPYEAVANAVMQASSSVRVLGLSLAGAKRVLLAVPPRKTLRLLKMRSLDSVTKRFDARMVYTVASRVEDDSWHSQVAAKIRRLASKDIAWQEPHVGVVPAQWLPKLAEVLPRGIVLTCSEVGSVVLLPLGSFEKPGMFLYSVATTLQAVQQLEVYSLPYRRVGLLSGYEHVLSQISLGELPKLDPVHGVQPTWEIVHRLIGSGHIAHRAPEMEFELGDIQWTSVEFTLSQVLDTARFWIGTHFLARKDTSGGVVSMHVLDVARSLIENRPFGQQTSQHLQASLWNELHVRYMQTEMFTAALVSQLENSEEPML